MSDDINLNILIFGESFLGEAFLESCMSIDLTNNKFYTSKINDSTKLIRINGMDILFNMRYCTKNLNLMLPGVIESKLAKAHAIVLLYDITQSETFEQLKNDYIDLIKTHSKDAKLILIGVNSDKENERKVLKDEVKNFSKKNKMKEIEVTQLNDNVHTFFDILVELLIGNKSKKKLIEKYCKKDEENSESKKKCIIF